MAVQKRRMPSFASIISVLSIAFYCAGFLRVELELQEQKKAGINGLESIGEAKSLSNEAEINILHLPKVNRKTRNEKSQQILENIGYGLGVTP